MILAIDIGNTNTVLGFFKEDELQQGHRFASDDSITVDELKLKFLQILECYKIEREDIEAVIVASVVPNLIRAYEILIKDFFNIDAIFVRDLVEKFPLKISFDNKKELGDDRIINALSAYRKFFTDIIIVDFGTAITFDVVTKKDGYVGGVIYPGINLAVHYLAHATAKLPQIGLKKTKGVVGKNTIHAMESGIYHGYLAMIEGMIGKISGEYDEEFKVIATGGMGKIFYENSKKIEAYCPDLTLEGLKILYNECN